ncbi:MAG: phosphate/phosphite/phosphonate ABC transporter substrate-binding protein [Candidatus Brachytrichaceae bacterium NZ_4S206]|jgi:phosphonate transport system substrate-binding protein
MNRRKFLRASALTAGSAAFASIVGKAPAFALNLNQSPSEFKVGIFAGSDAEQTLKAAEPIRAHLEKSLGIPVKLSTGSSYSAVIEAVRNKFVDAFEVGPFAYVLASSQTKLDPLAVGIYPRVPRGGVAVYNPKESPFYFSVIFTKKGSGIRTLEDLRGKRFAFVDPASTSGNLIPRTLLLKNKIDPDKDMQSVFAGSHPSALIAVWNDKADAGANFEDNLYTLANQGQVDVCGFADGINRRRTPKEIELKYNACKDGQIVIIAYSDPIPNTPFAVRDELPAQFKAAVKDALLAVRKDPALVAAYRQWYVDPVVEYPTLRLKNIDAFFNGLRDAARLLKLDLTTMR